MMSLDNDNGHDNDNRDDDNGNDDNDNGSDDDDDNILHSCLLFMWGNSKKLWCGLSVFSHMTVGSE
jgi:hypothetical protein